MVPSNGKQSVAVATASSVVAVATVIPNHDGHDSACGGHVGVMLPMIYFSQERAISAVDQNYGFFRYQQVFSF